MYFQRVRAPFCFILAIFLLAALAPATAKATPVFGSVIAIGGSASDIALDEARGQLYAANFGANVIDVISTSDNTIKSSINVLPFPGALALSTDGRYLLVAHYCNLPASSDPTKPGPTCTNAVTSIDLIAGTQQVFSLASAPLGIAFVKNGSALVVTTTNFLSLNPATGATQLVQTIANVAQTIAVPLATFPGQIIQASLTTSGNGNVIWGIASAGTSSQLIFKYSSVTNAFDAAYYVSSPLLLPRISTATDGSYAMVGYSLVGDKASLKGRYPNVIQSANITGSAIDFVSGTIYAQIPDPNQPTGPGPVAAGSAAQSAMVIMDADNLTFRDRISIPENMTGRAVLNAAASVLYAVSESGVMVLPVGALNTAHRIIATKEDLLFTTNFCNSDPLSQSLTITDPGGGATDFTVTAAQPGVTILPASGVTPATVKILIDPAIVRGSGGTTAVTLNVTSNSAVNHPKPVRVLVSNPDPSQRGVLISQPGVLSDILADQTRNRIYVLRQDMNQLQVYDGLTMGLLATLRTATTPTMMAMTRDQNYLLVGHDDSQYVYVYDLNTLTAVAPVLMPGGHFARSIAASNSAILALARNEGGNPVGIIDSINLAAETATALPTLGVYSNSLATATGVLTASPNGSNILLASPEGNVALYSAATNTFIVSRHDVTSFSGAFAASDFGSYVVGNSVLNASLVPSGTIAAAGVPTSGFTFVNQGGYLATAASSSTAGTLAPLASLQPGATSQAPLLMTEAPVLPTVLAPSTSTSTTFGIYGSGGNSTHAQTSFSRTLAVLPNAGTIVALSTSGFTVLATSYPAKPAPAIAAIISAADGSPGVAPGGLVSIYGQNLSPASAAATSVPLTTGLANSCIGVNGSPIPLLYVSPGQINAQLPFNASGNTTLTIHSPDGLSNNYPLTVQSAAPSVFMAGTAGPETGLALIVRNINGQIVTPTNPIHPKDVITILLTGMGQTSPAIVAGIAAPSDPLSRTSLTPTLSLSGSDLSVTYAGLAPGLVGVYQINATVPIGVKTGLTMPLVISEGGASTTLNVRVVN